MDPEDRDRHHRRDQRRAEGGYEPGRDQEAADELAEAGHDGQQQTRAHAHLVEEAAGPARPVGREELRRRLRRHELLEPVAHEQEPGNESKNKQSDIHVRSTSFQETLSYLT